MLFHYILIFRPHIILYCCLFLKLPPTPQSPKIFFFMQPQRSRYFFFDFWLWWQIASLKRLPLNTDRHCGLEKKTGTHTHTETNFIFMITFYVLSFWSGEKGWSGGGVGARVGEDGGVRKVSSSTESRLHTLYCSFFFCFFFSYLM